MYENEFVEVSHDWFRLNIQLAENLIAAPVVDHLDDVAVNSGTDKRYVTCSAEGTSGDVLGFKTQVLAA